MYKIVKETRKIIIKKWNWGKGNHANKEDSKQEENKIVNFNMNICDHTLSI